MSHNPTASSRYVVTTRSMYYPDVSYFDTLVEAEEAYATAKKRESPHWTDDWVNAVTIASIIQSHIPQEGEEEGES